MNRIINSSYANLFSCNFISTPFNGKISCEILSVRKINETKKGKKERRINHKKELRKSVF